MLQRMAQNITEENCCRSLIEAKRDATAWSCARLDGQLHERGKREPLSWYRDNIWTAGCGSTRLTFLIFYFIYFFL